MTYSSPYSPVSSILECPDCGRHSIVQHQETRYICLSCNWEKDIAKVTPPERPKDPPIFSFPFWLGTGLLLFLIL